MHNKASNAMANWIKRIAEAINREYERRIRRASQITVYGQHHAVDQDEHEGEVEIVNLPRGAIVDDKTAM